MTHCRTANSQSGLLLPGNSYNSKLLTCKLTSLLIPCCDNGSIAPERWKRSYTDRVNNGWCCLLALLIVRLSVSWSRCLPGLQLLFNSDRIPPFLFIYFNFAFYHLESGAKCFDWRMQKESVKPRTNFQIPKAVIWGQKQENLGCCFFQSLIFT